MAMGRIADVVWYDFSVTKALGTKDTNFEYIAKEVGVVIKKERAEMESMKATGLEYHLSMASVTFSSYLVLYVAKKACPAYVECR